MEVAAIWSEQIFESYYMGRQPCSNEWNLWTLVWSFADYRTVITNRAPHVQNIATGLSRSTVITLIAVTIKSLLGTPKRKRLTEEFKALIGH